VPVLIECLDPSVTRLNGELTSITLSLKHHRPVYNNSHKPLQSGLPWRLLAQVKLDSTHCSLARVSQTGNHWGLPQQNFLTTRHFPNAQPKVSRSAEGKTHHLYHSSLGCPT